MYVTSRKKGFMNFQRQPSSDDPEESRGYNVGDLGKSHFIG